MPVSPSIFPYADAFAYVRDWLEHRPRLSQRWLARKVSSSPSRVSMVLSRQRTLPLDEAELWAHAMGLDEREAAHFEAMVAAENAPTEALREDARRSVRAGQDRARASPIDSAASWLGSWVHLAILEAARHRAFDGHPEALAARLWPPVDVDTVESAIADLRASGALARTPSGWRTDDRPLRTAMRIQQGEVSAAASRLHRDQLRHALRALDELPGPVRHVASITVGVATDRVDDFLQATRELPMRMVAAYADDEPDEVVELLVAAYPRTVSSS